MDENNREDDMMDTWKWLKNMGLVALTVGVAACGSGPVKKVSDENSSPGSSSSVANSGGSGGQSSGAGGSSGSSATGGASCSEGEDCAYWYCDCADGSIVNARTCYNNQCTDPFGTCPNACESFATTWTGYVVSPPSDGGSTSSSGGTCSGVDPSFVNDGECYSCGESRCCFDLQECSDNPDCVDFGRCVRDGFGYDTCLDWYPGAETDASFLDSCLLAECQYECL